MVSEDNEEKEPITQKQFLDGCAGCSLGCLPVTSVFIVFIVTLFY
jgi:hypothetical protein